MFGLAGGAPRAVPSDFAVAVASRLLPADIVQKLVLLLIFVLACSGAAALLDREPVLARLAAAVFYGWNPYVAERLIIGQWALLLGYAGLPWVLRAVLRLDDGGQDGGEHSGKDGGTHGTARLALALLPAVVGGFAAMAITALMAVPVAVSPGGPGPWPWCWPRSSSAACPGSSRPGCTPCTPTRPAWPRSRPGPTPRSAPRQPGHAGRDVERDHGAQGLRRALVRHLAGARAGRHRRLRAARRRRHRWPGLATGAVAGLVIAAIGVTAPGRALLRGAIGFWPGFAIMRDGQQFTAPLALAEAAGFGLAVAWCMHPGSFGRQKPDTERPRGKHRAPALADAPGLALGVFALLAPVLLLPGLAWGRRGGCARPGTRSPTRPRRARSTPAAPPGRAAAALGGRRTPAWNHGEVMLDAWPRLVSRPVIWNDGTVVGNVALAPDDPRARGLDGVIGSVGPLTAALRAAGVRFVVVDAAPPDARDPQDAQDTPAAPAARLHGHLQRA